MTALLLAALAYASAGVPVLPLVPHEKRPACRRGVLAASLDPAVVRAWWRRAPACGVGLATGVRFDVVDVDPGGDESVAAWCDDVLPVVLGESATPRGRHLYVPRTGDSNARGFRPGLDYRGVRGYVVAPPTPGYRWVREPAWLPEALTAP